jgi:hypothetical protein
MQVRFYDTNLSYHFSLQVWRVGFSVDYWYDPIGTMFIPVSFCHWIQNKDTYARGRQKRTGGR